jgi:hypothetical protein
LEILSEGSLPGLSSLALFAGTILYLIASGLYRVRLSLVMADAIV